jgi:hypothetical protein
MQNPDPQTPRDAAPRRHDTVWNSIVTSVPGTEIGRFPATSRRVRNRDIDDLRSNQPVDSQIELNRRFLIDVRHAPASDQILHRNQITR